MFIIKLIVFISKRYKVSADQRTNPKHNCIINQLHLVNLDKKPLKRIKKNSNYLFQ